LGHPAKLDEHGKQAIMQEVLKDRKQTFTQVARNAPEKISTSTMSRVATHEGYHRQVAQKVPFLMDRQKKKRLEWAKEFDGIDNHEWDNLIATDECYIELDDNKG
jgi:hypothetical protein